MAKLGSRPVNTLDRYAPSSRRGPVPGVLGMARARNLLPPLLLALLAVFAAVLAQALRPTVIIDIGDYYDRLYVRGFHAPETAPVLPQQSYQWPTGSDELVIAEPNPLMRLALLEVAPLGEQPDWGEAALYLNGRRVETIRAENGNQFQLPLPPLNGPLRIAVRPVDETGGALAVRPVSLTLAAAQTYRWTTEEGVVRLPGLGRGGWLVALAATSAHPDGSAVNAQLWANDRLLATLPDASERRRYHLLVPPEVANGGAVELRLRAQTFADPRPLGLLVEQVSVAPLRGGPLWPSGGALLALLALALSSYASLAWLRVPRWWAALGGALVLVGATWAMLGAHGTMGYYLPRLALLGVASLALVLLLDPLVAWVFARAGVPLQPQARYGLLLLFLGGVWLKAGAMLWPYFVGIDVSWHMERVRWVLDGRLAEMYRPGGFSESVMPASEWGDERPLIPYSPFFYIFGTVFTLSPLPLVMTAYMFSALVDNSRVFLIALLARKGGFSTSTALLGAALYAVTPVTFLLHSWGNIPTTFGLWWTLVSTVFIVVAYQRLHRPWPFATLTLLLTGTFLLYTVTATFMGGFLVLLAGALWWLNRAEGRRPIYAMLWATVAASGLALLIYYGQFIAPIIERTLPYFSQTIREGQSAIGLEQETWGQYLSKFPDRLDYSGRPLYYGLLIPLLFYPLALWLGPTRRLLAVLLSALALALLFLVVGLRVPMVDKQVFYMIPFAALAGGVVWARLWRRGRIGRIVTLLWYGFTLVAALDLWLYRVVNVQQ